MPRVLKPKFEQARHEALTRRKPLREADLVAIQARMVALMDALPGALVERAHRPNRVDPLIELTVLWTGLGADDDEVTEILQGVWPGDVFGDLSEYSIAETVDEVVALRFVAWNDTNYVTGKVSVRLA